MSSEPGVEERERKIDILKTTLNADAVRPEAISIDTIMNGVAQYEEETVAKWIHDLTKNPDCPLEYYSDSEAAICFDSREEALLYIDALEKDPWFQPDLD